MTDLGPRRAKEIDRSDMLSEIAGLPGQLRDGYESARSRLSSELPADPPVRPDGLVVCGMGGSAIGADLVLACLPDVPVPTAVVRGYELPGWVGSGTLAVVVSHSGETEEALACATQARSRGCVPVCVTSGGSLAALAEAEGLPLVPVPGGGQPRAAVGALSMSVLAVAEAFGLARDHAEDVARAVAQLDADNEILGPGHPDDDNPAKTLARKLEGRMVMTYGAGPTVPVARRWKGQINENAKAPAFFSELPEMDHNEIMGWTSLPQVTASSFAVFLADESAGERLLRRAELTAREYEALGVATELVAARGGSRLVRLFSLVQLGDYVSCYLALLYGVDPTPVDAIEVFKTNLSGEAG